MKLSIVSTLATTIASISAMSISEFLVFEPKGKEGFQFPDRVYTDFIQNVTISNKDGQKIDEIITPFTQAHDYSKGYLLSQIYKADMTSHPYHLTQIGLKDKLYIVDNKDDEHQLKCQAFDVNISTEKPTLKYMGVSYIGKQLVKLYVEQGHGVMNFMDTHQFDKLSAHGDTFYYFDAFTDDMVRVSANAKNDNGDIYSINVDVNVYKKFSEQESDDFFKIPSDLKDVCKQS